MVNRNITNNKVKFISLSLSLSTIFLSYDAFAAHPLFAKVPAAMQTKTQNKAMPNILLSIDNSGSMTSTVPGTKITRMQSVKDAVSNLFDLKEDGEYLFRDKFRWGLSVFNYQTQFSDRRSPSGYTYWQMPKKNATTGAVSYDNVGSAYASSTSSSYSADQGMILEPVRDPSDTHIANIQRRIGQMVASGGTPLSESAYRAYHHFATDPETIQYRCQKNNLIIVGDGEAGYNTTLIKRAAEQDFIMDGFGANRSVNDKEGSSFDSPPFANQTVQTSTIGYGSTDIAALQNIANAGNGVYVRVNNTAELAAGLKKILESAGPYKGYSAVPTLSASDMANVDSMDKSVGLTIEADGWVSMVEIRPFTTDALGNKLTDTKATVKPADYSHEAELRTVISTPSGLRFFDTTATKNSITFNNDSFNIMSSDKNFWQKWVKWAAAHHDQEDKNVGLRNRGPMSPFNTSRRNIGDVLDSPVLLLGDIVTYSSNKLNIPRYMVFGSNDGMVKIYTAYTNANPYRYRFSYIPGTAPRENDSILMKDLPIRSDLDYGTANKPHEYFVNGGMSSRQTENDQLFIVGALGQGGKAAYALNIAGKDHKTGKAVGLGTLGGTSYIDGIISNKDDYLKTVPLWDTSSSQFGNAFNSNLKLGYTIGTPIIARVALERDMVGMPKLDKDVRYATFISNGYEGIASSPSLYVLDALGLDVGFNVSSSSVEARNGETSTGKGALIQTLSTLAGAKNGLSSPAVVDIDFDNIVDLVYAGDLNGNVYRFDLRGKTPSDWTSTMIYEGSPTQPITSAPAVHLSGKNEITVVFGTGSNIYVSDIEVEDINTVPRQSLYGIKDDVTFINPPAHTPTTFKDRDVKNGLMKQELSYPDASDTIYGRPLIIGSRHTVKKGEKFKGWYIDLTAGELIVNQPVVIDKTVMFSTLVLKNMAALDSKKMCDATQGGAYGSIISLDAVTGIMPLKTQANLNKTIKLPDGIKEISGYIMDSPVSALSAIGNNRIGEQDANGLIKRVAKSIPLQYVNNLKPGTTGTELIHYVKGSEVHPSGQGGNAKDCGKNTHLGGSSGSSGSFINTIDCGAATNNIRVLSWREIF